MSATYFLLYHFQQTHRPHLQVFEYTSLRPRTQQVAFVQTLLEPPTRKTSERRRRLLQQPSRVGRPRHTSAPGGRSVRALLRGTRLRTCATGPSLHMYNLHHTI